jgi:hypothetical protein
MAPIFKMAFVWLLFLEALASVRNFIMQKFLHFLQEQTLKKKIKKNVAKKKIKMAAKFKMATKTKFACVAKKLLKQEGFCIHISHQGLS